VAELGEFFHKIVDMLPWHQESDKVSAHEDVEETVLPAFGRNTTPAGVQTSDTTSEGTTETTEPVGPNSFPTGSGE
jgi:hypothetical protein